MWCARWLISLVCAGAPIAVGAQLAPRDSLRILRDARAAQFRFEVTRRANLPRVGPSESHECQVVVGRMCYWDDNDDPEPPRAEPRAIVTARQKLIATLDRLNALSRADPWIAGQRVRYLVESGDDSAAVVAARECWAARWWCEALLGFADHEGEHYTEAQAAFDSALAAMPADIRCRWTDISLLLDDDIRDQYLKLPCAARAPIEQRFWEMAHPSYVIAANDRRTEHFSRMLLADLSQDSENAYGLRWGDDLRELLIRYGQPLWYATSWPTMVGLGQGMPTPTGHDRHPSYHFAASLDGDSVRWDVRTPHARERYSPPYLDSLVDLDAQFVMVRRGDSALVVAVFPDTARGDSTVLGVSAPHGAEIVGGQSATRMNVRRARAAWKGLVVGIERFDPRRRIDARARTWIAPPPRAPDAPAMSTLLLFSGDTSVNVQTLDDALAHALVANELRGTRRLGIYWEMYGGETGADAATARQAAGGNYKDKGACSVQRSACNHGAAVRGAAGDSMMRDSVQGAMVRDSVRGSVRDSTTDVAVRDSVVRDTAGIATNSAPTARASGDSAAQEPPDIAITVARTDGGVLRWLGQTLHITRHDSPLVVRWHDARLEGGIAARSVVLDLAQLPAGTYRVTLAAGPDDAHQTRASREIRIR